MAHTALPFFQSQFLGRDIYLDEVFDLDIKELKLLTIESSSLKTTLSARAAALGPNHEDSGVVERMLRVSRDFSTATQIELAQRFAAQ